MLIDLKGQRFNRLEVVEFSHTSPKRTYWKCRCDCGNIKIVRADSLKDNTVKSCGCLKKEWDKINLDAKTHNQSKTRLYEIWCNMRRRCGEKTLHSYSRYGGRGIKIDKKWVNDFSAFHEWANNSGYNESLTLDRIDVNGDYTPINCRWANLKQQGNNKRNNIVITDNGELLTLSNFCDKYNLNYDTTKRRYYLGDRTVERLTRPLRVIKQQEKKTPR